jgi:dTDP-4-amino-4,6-dideoxygalactose transaminase
LIPFVDLKAQYASIKPEVDAAVLGVLDSCQFTLGKEVEKFEEEFSAFCSVNFAVGVNTGTSALHLALLAAGIGPGDEVITVPFTFVATVAAIHYVGARPVFVDIDPETFTMDPARLESVITPRTKAILPVHLYGQPADMDPILEIAKRNGLIVIEDAAQAHAAEYNGIRAGSMGDMGCFSFYPGKNLGAYGEGGMVITNNPQYARKIRMLRDWGSEKKYHHVLRGYNFRLEGIQGAVLRVKLKYLEKWTAVRRAAAAYYDEKLKDTGIPIPKARPYARHVYHVYAIRTAERQKWQNFLQLRDIQTGIHYPIPVHLQEAYSDPRYQSGDFPHSEKAAAEVLSLPMYPELTRPMQDEVIDVLIELSLPRTRFRVE